MSQNTGTAPTMLAHALLLIQLKSVTSTSSPVPMPCANNVKCSASVALATLTQYLRPARSAKLRSKSSLFS